MFLFSVWLSVRGKFIVVIKVYPSTSLPITELIWSPIFPSNNSVLLSSFIPL